MKNKKDLFAKLLFLFVLSIAMSGCGSSSDSGSSGGTGTITGTVSVSVASPNQSAEKVANFSSSAASGATVYVAGDSSSYATTSDDGGFTITGVSSGEQCIYAIYWDAGKYQYGDCVNVQDGQTTDVGSVTANSDESQICTTNADCWNNYNLPPLDTYSSIHGSSTDGFTCNGTADDGTKYCVHSASSTSGLCGGGDSNTYNFFGECTGATCATSLADYIWAIVGPSGLCEVSYQCSTTVECPSGMLCSDKGMCVKTTTLSNISNGTCQPLDGCASSSYYCLPFSNSTSCASYCMKSSLWETYSPSEGSCETGHTYHIWIANNLESTPTEITICVSNDTTNCQ